MSSRDETAPSTTVTKAPEPVAALAESTPQALDDRGGSLPDIDVSFEVEAPPPAHNSASVSWAVSTPVPDALDMPSTSATGVSSATGATDSSRASPVPGASVGPIGSAAPPSKDTLITPTPRFDAEPTSPSPWQGAVPPAPQGVQTPLSRADMQAQAAAYAEASGVASEPVAATRASSPPAVTGSSPPPSASDAPSSSGSRKPPPPPPVKRTARRAGEDLLSDFFESMHDVNFCVSALDGAEFSLRLALAKLPCRVALCHFFDINRREFVVVRAVSPADDAALLFRTPERTRGIVEPMTKGRAMLVADASADDRFSTGRWAFVGEPVRSALTVPVRQGGRYLGLLELANPVDGTPFTEAEADALTYLGSQLAEFLGQRGITISPEQIRAYRRT